MKSTDSDLIFASEHFPFCRVSLYQLSVSLMDWGPGLLSTPSRNSWLFILNYTFCSMCSILPMTCNTSKGQFYKTFLSEISLELKSRKGGKNAKKVALSIRLHNRPLKIRLLSSKSHPFRHKKTNAKVFDCRLCRQKTEDKARLLSRSISGLVKTLKLQCKESRCIRHCRTRIVNRRSFKATQKTSGSFLLGPAPAPEWYHPIEARYCSREFLISTEENLQIRVNCNPLSLS